MVRPGRRRRCVSSAQSILLILDEWCAEAELKAWEQDFNLQQQRSQLQALEAQLGHLRVGAHCTY